MRDKMDLTSMYNCYYEHEVLRCINCPKDILEKFVNDEDYVFRSLVARNPNCSEDLLLKLSKDENDFVLECVAAHPNCPDEILREFYAKDDSIRINAAVVSNAYCPYDIYRDFIRKYDEGFFEENFSEKDNIFIESCIAKSKFCTPSFMSKFIFDKSDEYLEVRNAIASNENCPNVILRELIKEEGRLIKESVASNPNCSEEFMKELAFSKDWFVRSFLAKNPSCPEEVLLALSQDENSNVRCAVAQSFNCSEDLLLKLSEDESPNVRCAVAENSKSTSKVLKNIILNRENNNEVLLYLVDNPNTNYENLAKVFAYNAMFSNKYGKDILNRKLDKLEQTTFIEHFDIEAFRTENLINAVNELDKIFKKAEIMNFEFKPLEKEVKIESEDILNFDSDKDRIDDGIDL